MKARRDSSDSVVAEVCKKFHCEGQVRNMETADEEVERGGRGTFFFFFFEISDMSMFK